MSDSNLGLALVGLLLIFLLGRMRRERIARSILHDWKHGQSVSFDAMQSLVAELTPTLGGQAMVPTPSMPGSLPPAERGDIWSTPCGKRVYMN